MQPNYYYQAVHSFVMRLIYKSVYTHLTANENKKRNILTCNELPSVELKEEKSGKKVRVKISGGGETEHVYT